MRSVQQLSWPGHYCSYLSAGCIVTCSASGQHRGMSRIWYSRFWSNEGSLDCCSVAIIYGCGLDTECDFSLMSCRETLRCNPVVAGLFRIAVQDFDMGGYQVQQGTPVLAPFDYLAAHDERWIGQRDDLHPSVFNPDRMMTEEGSRTGAQMPFGHGPRCVHRHRVRLCGTPDWVAISGSCCYREPSGCCLSHSQPW